MADGFASVLSQMEETLRRGAERQIKEYKERFVSAKKIYGPILSSLVVEGFDYSSAAEAAQAFFGSKQVRFAGIDGTEYSKPIFDLVVFFGGAYACTGTISFGNSGIEVEYDVDSLEQSKGICSCVPLYVNDLPEIDTSIAPPDGLEGAGSLDEDRIVTNSEIANRIMTFAEFFLALKLASRPEGDIRVILMDRTLSGELGSLVYDTSQRGLWKRISALIGYQVDGTPIDENELYLSRHRIYNKRLGTLPPRGDYLPYAVLHLLEDGATMEAVQIAEALGIPKSSVKRVEKTMRRLKSRGIVADILGAYRLSERYESYWQRVKKMVLEVGESIFETAGDSPCMTVPAEQGRRYLTTVDLAFLTLFTINMLIEECWRRRILLVGITKDTAASDFKRHVLPILSNIGAFEEPLDPGTYRSLPNTDRLLLQAASLMNHDQVHPPWALVEYDSALKTIVPDPSLGPLAVRGAIRNKIIPERLMVKSYVQLSMSAHDPMFRSNVLLIDRLVHPGFDAQEHQLCRFVNQYGGAREAVDVILHTKERGISPLQNLTMAILCSMTGSNSPELFGHNKPLFVADKVAKWNNRRFREMVRATASWIRTNPDLREFVFYMSSFRERRSRIEYARRSR